MRQHVSRRGGPHTGGGAGRIDRPIDRTCRAGHSRWRVERRRVGGAGNVRDIAEIAGGRPRLEHGRRPHHGVNGGGRAGRAGPT
jgi:hypothetical protein